MCWPRPYLAMAPGIPGHVTGPFHLCAHLFLHSSTFFKYWLRVPIGSGSARCCVAATGGTMYEPLDSVGIIDYTPGIQVWLWGPQQLSWWLKYYHLPSPPAPENLGSLSCYCALRCVILPYFPLHRVSPWHQHKGGPLALSEIAPMLPWLHDQRGSTLYKLGSWRRCRISSALWIILLASYSELGYLYFQSALNLLFSFKISFSLGLGLALLESNILFIFSLFPALSFPL